jgi:hypothetical protein
MAPSLLRDFIVLAVMFVGAVSVVYVLGESMEE